MTHKKRPTTLRYFVTAVCGMALALSSCVVETHMGQALRDVTTVRTGVDTFHPVDGKVYYAKVGGKGRFYMLAPEVTYISRCPAIVDIYDNTGYIGPAPASLTGEPVALDVKPTGRRHWVEVSMEAPDGVPGSAPADPDPRKRCAAIYASSFVRIVDGLPKGAKVWLDGETYDKPAPADYFGTLSERKRTGSWAVTALSYPISYVVDPICTAIPTAVTFTTSYLGVMVAGLTIEFVDWLAAPPAPRNKEEWAAVNKKEQEKLAEWKRKHPKIKPGIHCYARGTSYTFSYGDDDLRGCASAFAEGVDKSRTYKLYTHSLSPDKSRDAARQLRAHGIKVDVIFYGNHSTDEMIRTARP